MGGCASRPKEFQNHPDSAPAEKTEQPEAEFQQERANGGEKKNEIENEAPLVDLSEPKKEEAEESSKTMDANGETAENETEETEKKVEAAVVDVEPKANKSDIPTGSETEKTNAPLVTV